MLILRYFVLSVCLLTGLKVSAQNTNSVHTKLLKRYGNVVPWGEGYILKANSFYGFADFKGRIIIPIRHTRFDTLLEDRACIKAPYRNYELINEKGKVLATGGTSGFWLVNRKQRLLATMVGDDETLCNDRGQIIIAESYDPQLSKESMITSYDAIRNWYGIVNLNGDTLLPTRYEKVSYGKQIFAGWRKDTVFVFQRKQGFLFKMPGVHGCKVLANDFIAMEKYGSFALVNRSGKVLTAYKYLNIEAFLTADSVVYIKGNPHAVNERGMPDYISVERGQFNGVIDSTGKEVLPLIYDRITRYHNGWFVVNKFQHGKDELLDPSFKKVLETEHYGFDFLDNRYVNVEDGRYTKRPRTRTYDIVLNRFLEPEQTKQKVEPQPYSANYEPEVNYEELMKGNPNNEDTLVINYAASLLIKKNKRWGILSLLGDTILPFVYDTAGEYGSERFFVGRNAKFAYLDWEGNLAMPLELNVLAELDQKDSLIYVSGQEVYSYKGWKLRKLDEKELLFNSRTQFWNGFTYTAGNSSFKKGLYNRAGKRVAEFPYYGNYSNTARMTGIIAIRDSATQQFTVIDSTGRQLIPWLKPSRGFLLADNYALIINDTNKADLLFRFVKGKTLRDEVWLDPVRKKRIMFGPWFPYQTHDTWEGHKPMSFEKRGYGYGIENGRNVLLIKGTQSVKMTDNMAVLKIKGKWGLYTDLGEEKLAPLYDSIRVEDYFSYLLFKNGKTGVFDLRRNKIHAPVYDSICSLGSLYNHFFIGYKNNGAEFVDQGGKVISKGWQLLKHLHYTTLSHISAKRYGKTYFLYPSAGDSLFAEPVPPLPDSTKLVEDYSEGSLLLAKGNFRGIYNTIAQKWILPPQYNYIKNTGDYFVIETYSPQTFGIFTGEGDKLFLFNKGYHSPSLLNSYQWHLNVHNSDYEGVFNNKGKMIVPDTFDIVYELQTPQMPLYQTATKDQKYGLIDTSGKVLYPATLDGVNDRFMYTGYFEVWKDGKSALMDPSAKLITPFIYEDIKEAKPEPQEHDYFYVQIYTNEMALLDTTPYFIVTMGEYENLKFGILNEKGKVMIPCVYDSILHVQNGKVVIVKKGKYWGLVDLKNKKLTEFIYDSIETYRYGQARFRRGKNTGYLLENGKESKEGE